MKREELIAMGVSEEDADKIMADYGSSIQREKAKTAQYKEQAEKADELQKSLMILKQETLQSLIKLTKHWRQLISRLQNYKK